MLEEKGEERRRRIMGRSEGIWRRRGSPRERRITGRSEGIGRRRGDETETQSGRICGGVQSESQ